MTPYLASSRHRSRAVMTLFSLAVVLVMILSACGGGSGNNAGLGASRLTGDIVNMVAQVPALFELLSGTRIGDLMNRVPALAGQDGNATNGNSSVDGTGTGTTVDAKVSDK